MDRQIGASPVPAIWQGRDLALFSLFLPCPSYDSRTTTSSRDQHEATPTVPFLKSLLKAMNVMKRLMEPKNPAIKPTNEFEQGLLPRCAMESIPYRQISS